VDLRQWQLAAHKAITERGDSRALFARGDAAVYEAGFVHRVHGFLEKSFPLLRRLIGGPALQERVRAFLAADHRYHIEFGSLVPAFVSFLEGSGERSTVARAARLDAMEQHAARAPDPVSGGDLLGLHPSASLLESEGRRYVVWREEGCVRRERLRAQDLALLRCFEEGAELAEISTCLERIGFEPEFVQESVSLWVKLGLISSSPPARAH
jgi:hypothetical protein